MMKRLKKIDKKFTRIGKELSEELTSQVKSIDLSGH